MVKCRFTRPNPVTVVRTSANTVSPDRMDSRRMNKGGSRFASTAIAGSFASRRTASPLCSPTVSTANASTPRMISSIAATAGANDAIDGIKVNKGGNVYVSGPSGLWIFSPTGKHLGTLRGPEHPHNMAWGDTDKRTLYLAAQTGIYRIRLNVPGASAFAK